MMRKDACAGNGAYSGSAGNETLEVVSESTNLAILYTPDPASSGISTDFFVILTSGGPNSPGVGGKDVILSFGDGTGNFTSSTNSSGVADFTHTYATVGTYASFGIFTGVPPNMCSPHMALYQVASGTCSNDAQGFRLMKYR